MTIVSRYGDPIEVACDDCGFVFEADEDEEDFKEVLAEMRKVNWTVRKVGDDWFHYCGDCNGKNNPSPRGRRP